MNRQLDRLQEVCMRIHNSHLIYLETDDSPSKIQERSKLEGFIKEYLCLVSTENKYVFQETAYILQKSAETLSSFSAYRASEAWTAISMYASNLLAQPWRKEYRIVKTYSGYYKHEIEANLIQADLMFELMGYKHSRNSVLTLDGPIDPDKVSSVSRDAIVVFVECQILKQIFENVSQSFTVSWREIMEFRNNNVGTAEQAVRSLNHQLLQRNHRNRAKSENYQRFYPYQSNLYRLDNIFLDDNDSIMSNKNSCGAMTDVEILPQYHDFVFHPACYEKKKKNPQVVFDTHKYEPMEDLTKRIVLQLDDKCEKNNVKVRASNFETGQTGLNSIESYPKYPCETETIIENSIRQNLVLNKSSNSLDRAFDNVRHSNDIEGRRNCLPKMNQLSRENEYSTLTVEYDDNYSVNTQTPLFEIAEKKISNEDCEKNLSSLDLIDFDRLSEDVQEEEIHQSKEYARLSVMAEKFAMGFNNEKQNSHHNDWNCPFCTFINTPHLEICQMCGKSKKCVSNEKPLESGSKQCPQCTLINEKNATNCEVCETNLKNSPTYV